MTQPLTDKELLAAYDGPDGLSHENGFQCGRRLTENGVLGTEYTCRGHAAIQGGKVKLKDTCGEPCSYVCDDSQALSKSVESLKYYDKIIRRVRG